MLAPKISFQNRDIILLRGLFESRVMSAKHAAALYFENKSHAARKRLQKLKSAGFITERPRRAFEPSVLFITRKGIVRLQNEGILAEYPLFALPMLERRARVSPLTIRHELEVMDVKTAFHAAIKTSQSFTIESFSTWPKLNEFKTYHPRNGAEISVKPDGFICVHEEEAGSKGFAHECFLEVDRSSETQDVLVSKAASYLDYYKSGGFAIRNGATRADYKSFPFRVLIVFKTAERRNNTAERLAHNFPPILTQTWLTTLAEVRADPFGPIWIQPGDYRNVTRGTPFYSEQPSRNFAYRHQPERDAFIESKIKKMRLLES